MASFACGLATAGLSVAGLESQVLGLSLVGTAVALFVLAGGLAVYPKLFPAKPPVDLVLPEPRGRVKRRKLNPAWWVFVAVYEVAIVVGALWFPIVLDIMAWSFAALVGATLVLAIIVLGVKGLTRVRFWWRRWRRNPYH